MVFSITGIDYPATLPETPRFVTSSDFARAPAAHLDTATGSISLSMNPAFVAADVRRLKLLEQNEIRASLRRLLRFMGSRREISFRGILSPRVKRRARVAAGRERGGSWEASTGFRSRIGTKNRMRKERGLQSASRCVRDGEAD
jgi:hypothetical protein